MSGKETNSVDFELQQVFATDKNSAAILIVPALLVTFLVSSLMVILVTSPQGQLQERSAQQALDFVRVKRTESIKQRENKPKKPKAPEVSPPPPMEMANSMPQVNAQKIPIKAVTDLPNIAMNDVGFNIGAIAEAEYLPIVKIAPSYPRRALSRDIQGHCTVEYTVTKEGTTRNVAVVESDCSHYLFKRPSINAAQKFRYQPRVVNGKAIEVSGIRNRFYYQIDQ